MRISLSNRLGMLLKIRRHPEIFDRLLFGTDYPLSVFHFPLWRFMDVPIIQRILKTVLIANTYLPWSRPSIWFSEYAWRPIGISHPIPSPLVLPQIEYLHTIS